LPFEQQTGDTSAMNIGPTKPAAVFVFAAAMLLLPFVANAAEEAPAEKPKPAIELGAPFADNAILQRQMPVPVWGWIFSRSVNPQPT
jgi:hypothetical protein